MFGSLVFDGQAQDFVHRLFDDDAIAAGERDKRIGPGFDVTNQFRIEDESFAAEVGEFDHDGQLISNSRPLPAPLTARGMGALPFDRRDRRTSNRIRAPSPNSGKDNAIAPFACPGGPDLGRIARAATQV